MDINHQHIIALIAGLLSGLISEVGGAGSLISLPMLIGAGLPPVVANGTNRVGMMLQYIFGFLEYRTKHGKLVTEALILSIPIVIGAIVGALFAAQISGVLMGWLVIGLTVFVIITSFMMPELVPDENGTDRPNRNAKVLDYFLLFLIGLYCGLVQSGVSYLILYVLVERLNAEGRTAQLLKAFLSMIATPFALIIFIYFGNINWGIALFLSMGSSVGGWIGAMMLEKFKALTIKHFYFMMLIISLVYAISFVIVNISKGVYVL